MQKKLVDLNTKSLLLGIILGFLSWIWAFLIVGSAFFDYTTNEPISNPNLGLYAILLVVNIIISVIILGFYLKKYEQSNPIIPENWSLDALLLGGILCAMNFILDAIFFGLLMQRNLIAYYFLETTTGYFYPAIILITWLIAYFSYGKER